MKWTNRGHQFDEIGKRFHDVEEIIIYGAGEYGMKLGKLLKGIKAPFVYLDDFKKSKGTCEGVKVIYHKDLEEEMKKKKCIIILALGRENAGIVLKGLELQGLRYGENVFDIHSFMNYYIYIYATYGLNKCIMQDCSVMGVFKCSLKCKHCVGAFPYMNNKENTAIDNVKRDIDILFSKIDYIKEFGMVCGDILLYEDTEEFISYVMENYSDQIGNCTVLVNGMLIPRQSIIDTVKKYNLPVMISNYDTVKGWKERHDRLIEVLSSNDIKVVDIEMKEWVDLGWTERKYHDNAEKLFDACGGQCRAFQDGKLFYCAHALTANRALYGLDDSEEGLDLTTEEDNIKKIITEYHLGYNKNSNLKMCHYCNGVSNVNQNTIPVAVQLER